MAFDTNRSRVVLFGGLAATLVGDTWEWDGENWTQVDDIGPSARCRSAMAYDRNRNRLVLFGGSTANGISGETWEWDGQDWTQVSAAGPQARTLHSMAFDSDKNVVTLFGGKLAGGTPAPETDFLNDTWEWDGQDWIQQEDTGPNRCGHAMAYDDNRKRLVLFGGNDAKAPEYGDTWEWDGATWTQRSDFGPPVCPSGASMVFTGAGCVLFGGTSGNVLQKQTWTWDGTYWTARQDIGPSARSQHAAAFDSGRRRVVLFGGDGPLGDTWEQNAAGLTLSSFTMTHLTGGTFLSGQAAVQLSGPAPANGAVIALSVPPSSGITLTEGMQTTIPAGVMTMQILISVLPDGPAPPFTVTFTATLQNANSLQAVTQVIEGA